MILGQTVPTFTGILFVCSLCLAEPSSFQVRIDVHDGRGKPFTVVTEKLCREWYPKINLLLFGSDAPVPFRKVRVVFERSIVAGAGELSRVVIPGFARDGVIRINSAYVAELQVSDSNDFPAMFVHELTHLVQNYPKKGNTPGWLAEGIADYVRHKYMEKDIEPRVHLGMNGNLQDFELERNVGDFETEGYKGGYTVAASFLFWLEVRKDEGIVRALNGALRDGRYSDSLFPEKCGAPLQSLWRDFVRESRANQ